MKKRKESWRVLFWHNDFPDGTKSHAWYGRKGPIHKRVMENIKTDAELEWHFHGGYITFDRATLLRRLKTADVLFAAYPWNMDMDDDSMHWFQAEESLLKILTEVKKKNKELKIFFLHEPHHLAEEFSAVGEFVNDLHEEVIYDYFLKN